MAAVVLKSVSKRFTATAAAVRELDLEIADRELMVLVGPSGCGKTTTLRMIAGLEEISDGEVWIDGRVVNDVPPRDRNIAMVFQNYALYPHMTVYKNMAFGMQLRYGAGWLGWLGRWKQSRQARAEARAGRQAIPQRVRETARLLGIEELLDRMPRQLSGGERQRVALGRAIVRQPAAFLFDEPLSNLDARLRLEMRRELKQLHERLQATMIYVTHDQVEALTLGDRVAVMHEGCLQQVGRPLEVYDRPANRFVAGFLGAPPMNFIRGELQSTADGSCLVTGALRLPLPPLPSAARQDGLAVELGVRPEHVRLAAPDTAAQDTAARATARVAMTEMLGDATVVQLAADATRPALVAKLPGRAPWAIDDEVDVYWDVEDCQVFAVRDGRNLCA